MRTFSFKYKPLYLLRHPFAVAASQMSHGGWNHEFAGFQIPDCPFREFYDRHAAFLATLRSEEEVRVATWCLTNVVPLRHRRNNVDWITIHYEDLVTAPRAELTRAFQAWGMPLPDAVLEQVGVDSSTTDRSRAKDEASAGGDARLTKWRSAFSERQVHRMMDVLAYFEITLYGADPLPVREPDVAAPGSSGQPIWADPLLAS